MADIPRLTPSDAPDGSLLATRKPLDPDDLFASGVEALREQHLEEAIDWFRAAIAIRPGQPMYHFRLGAACQVGGRLDDAVLSFAQ